MIKKQIILSLGLLLLLATAGYGQFYKHKYNTKKPTGAEKFEKTQWWLGFKAGANLTQTNVSARYYGFSPVNYETSTLDKEYDAFDKIGGQAGLEITFYHQGFSFSFQPNYRRQSFSYSNNYQWLSTEDAANSIDLKYDYNHKLDYVEMPLIIKYDILRSTKFRPFVQIGGYYAVLTNANKEIEISGTDFASGNAGPFENENLIIGAKDLFINSSVGILGGVGVAYDFWNIRLVFDASYKHGLNNITNQENRYSENQLSGLGDALDDVQLNNLSFNFGALFPLRFISSEGHNAVR